MVKDLCPVRDSPFKQTHTVSDFTNFIDIVL